RAAERPALPHQGGLRGGTPARRPLGRRDWPDYRPSAQGPAHRGSARPAGASGDGQGLRLASPPGTAAGGPRARAPRAGALAARRWAPRRSGDRGGAMTAISRCAYLGPRGTFCEQAVTALHPDNGVELMACASIEATLEAVHSAQADRAVVPIESSVEGG